MGKAVFGLFRSEEQADRAVTRLQDAGFTSEQISVLFADTKGRLKRNTVQETAFEHNENLERTDVPMENRDFKKSKKNFGFEKGTKAPEGATTGAIAGGIVGGSLGLLAGLGSLAIPGLGVFVAAGPIIAALSGSAVGGSLGLLVGALVGMGIPEYTAELYQNALKNEGQVLLSVHVDSKRVDEVKRVLEQAGATEISTTREVAGTRG